MGAFHFAKISICLILFGIVEILESNRLEQVRGMQTTSCERKSQSVKRNLNPSRVTKVTDFFSFVNGIVPDMFRIAWFYLETLEANGEFKIRIFQSGTFGNWTFLMNMEKMCFKVP